MLRLWCLLLSLLNASALAQGIVVELESPVVFENTITGLEVRAWGIDGNIDLSPLWQQFEFVDETYGSMYRILDGKAQQVRIWHLNVRPKKAGMFHLPILTSENTTSEPRQYEVREIPATAWQPEPDSLKTYWRVETSAPYVQQGSLVTLIIEHRYPLSDLIIDWPTFSGLRVIDLGDERYLKRGEKRWVEKSWYIVGEQTGVFEQDAISFEAQLNRSRMESAVVQMHTEPFTLTVRELPITYKAKWVLVADSIEMEDAWSDPPNNLLVGQQRVRTITVRAEGALADQIPDITVHESRGVEIEPILPPKRTTKWVNNKPIATAQFSYLITARSPIPVFFDNVRLPWYSIPEDAPKSTLVYALRADIANPDADTLMAEAPIEEKPRTNWALLGALTAGLTYIIIWLVRGRPKRIQRIALMLWLWFASRTNNERQVYKALKYSAVLWRTNLTTITSQSSPLYTWYQQFSNGVFRQKGLSEPSQRSTVQAPIRKFDYWLASVK